MSQQKPPLIIKVQVSAHEFLTVEFVVTDR